MSTSGAVSSAPNDCESSSSRPSSCPPRAAMKNSGSHDGLGTAGSGASDLNPSLLELCGTLEKNLLNMGRALSCSICHSTVPSGGGGRGAVMLAECVHLFCPGCIQMCWRETSARNRRRQQDRGGSPQALCCPVCRHPATRRSLVDAPGTYRQAAVAYKHLLRAFGMAPMVYAPHLFMTQVDANLGRGRSGDGGGDSSVSDPPSLEGARANYQASIVLAKYQRSRGNAVAIREQDEVVRINRGYYRSRLREEAVTSVYPAVAGGPASGSGSSMANNTHRPPLQRTTTSRGAEDRLGNADTGHPPLPAFATAEELGDVGGALASAGPGMTQDSYAAALRDQCAIDAAWEDHCNELEELEVRRQELGRGPGNEDGQDLRHEETGTEATVQPPSKSPMALPLSSQVTPHTACDRRRPHQHLEPPSNEEELGKTTATMQGDAPSGTYAARDDAQPAESLRDSIMNEEAPVGPSVPLAKLLRGHQGRGEREKDPCSHHVTPFLRLPDAKSPTSGAASHDQSSLLAESLVDPSTSPMAAAQPDGCDEHIDSSIGSRCAAGKAVGGVRSAGTGTGAPTAAFSTDAAAPVSAWAAADGPEADEEPPTMAQGDGSDGVAVRASPDEAGVLKVGAVVHVAARTWPGMNKRGGVGRITKVFRRGPAGVSYNIRYVLGGAESHVDAVFVRLYDDSALGTSASTNEPVSSSYAASSPILARDESRDAEATLQRKSHRLEQHKVCDLSPSLLAQLVKEGFDVGAAAPKVKTEKSIGNKRGMATGFQSDQRNAKRSRRFGSSVASFVQRRMPLCTKANADRSESDGTIQGNPVCGAAGHESKTSAPTPPATPPPVPEYSHLQLCQRADASYHERFASAVSKRTVYVVASSLPDVDKAALDRLCRETKSCQVQVKRLDRFHSKKTTMCLVPSDADLTGLTPEDGDATDLIAENRTFKSMQAALAGVPLVAASWIRSCRAQTVVSAPLPSMWIRSLPCSSTYTSFGVARLASRLSDDPFYRPLSGFVVHFCGLIPRQKLGDLTLLLKEAGASILSHHGAVLSQMSKHASQRSPAVVMICGINTKLSSTLEAKVRELPPGSVWLVSTNWAFDCISAGQSLGPNAYEPVESGKQARALWKLTTTEL